MTDAERLMEMASSQEAQRDAEISSISEKYESKIASLRGTAMLVCTHPELEDNSFMDGHKGVMEGWFICKTCKKSFDSLEEAKR